MFSVICLYFWAVINMYPAGS